MENKLFVMELMVKLINLRIQLF